jgi:hypothetical protein
MEHHEELDLTVEERGTSQVQANPELCGFEEEDTQRLISVFRDTP